MIVPGGGFAREVRSMLPACGWDCGGLFDDQPRGSARSLQHLPAEGHIVLAVGDSQQRQLLYQRLQGGYHFPNLLYPSAILQDMESIQIGQGSIIAAGSVLTCNITLGDFCIVNLHCSIGHDCVLGNFASLMPGVRLSGGVRLGEGVYLGSNATVLPGLHIGAHAVVGAGAVVTRNVPARSTVKGIPAK